VNKEGNMSHEPIHTKITEIKLPQSKTQKDGSFLRQTLDDSHVVKQTPAKAPYGECTQRDSITDRSSTPLE
jgi:hypothetical protein